MAVPGRNEKVVRAAVRSVRHEGVYRTPKASSTSPRRQWRHTQGPAIQQAPRPRLWSRQSTWASECLSSLLLLLRSAPSAASQRPDVRMVSRKFARQTAARCLLRGTRKGGCFVIATGARSLCCESGTKRRHWPMESERVGRAEGRERSRSRRASLSAFSGPRSQAGYARGAPQVQARHVAPWRRPASVWQPSFIHAPPRLSKSPPSKPFCSMFSIRVLPAGDGVAAALGR